MGNEQLKRAEKRVQDKTKDRRVQLRQERARHKECEKMTYLYIYSDSDMRTGGRIFGCDTEPAPIKEQRRIERQANNNHR
jgi:hypothetical protein